MLKEFQMIINTTINLEPVSVIYHTKTDFIEEAEKYNKVNQEKIRDYCECYNKEKKLTVQEYNNNVEIVMSIYKEMISETGLQRIVNVFPKRYYGRFDTRKTMSICKSLNAVCDGTKHGYICNELIVKAINSRVLEIEYKKTHFYF